LDVQLIPCLFTDFQVFKWLDVKQVFSLGSDSPARMIVNV